MHYNPETVGKRIYIERKRLKLTQTELGEKVGVAMKQIWGYEHGRLFPPLKVLLRLCVLFDCSSSYILGEQEHRKASIKEDEILKYTGLELSALNSICSLTGAIRKMNRPSTSSSVFNELIRENGSASPSLSKVEAESVQNAITCLPNKTVISDCIPKFAKSTSCTDYSNVIADDNIYYGQRHVLNTFLSSERLPLLLQEFERLLMLSEQYNSIWKDAANQIGTARFDKACAIMESGEDYYSHPDNYSSQLLSDIAFIEETIEKQQAQENSIKATKYALYEEFLYLTNEIISSTSNINKYDGLLAR